MRFTTEHAHAILAGAKTQIRVPMTRSCRLASTARHHIRLADRNGELAGLYRPTPYHAGDQHTVQRPRHLNEFPTQDERLRYEEGKRRRGEVTVGRLVIVAVGVQFLADITFDEARAEGHRSRADFARAWMGFPADDNSSDQDVLDVFADVHAATPVWVLTVAPSVEDVPRSLGIKAVGYHGDELEPEPEPLSPADYKLHVEDRRHMTHRQWRTLEHTNRELEIALLTFNERRNRAARLARSKHINASSRLRVVDRLIAQQARPETIANALERVEAMVEPDATTVPSDAPVL